MFLPPSTIHYINSDKDNIIPAAIEQSIIDLSRKIVQNGDLPKVQAVLKEGYYFTLNNAQLDLCRRLEQDGKCTKVKVDVVPLSEVPEHVRGMMVLPDQCKKGGDQSRSTGKGYQKLGQVDTADKEETGSESEGEEQTDDSGTSESGDTDSECDWSEDEQDSSGVETSDNEAEKKPSDDERECLL